MTGPEPRPAAGDPTTRYGARKLHSLAGVVPVGAFLVLHLAVQATALGGAEAYDRTIAALRGLPFVLLLEVLLVYLPLALHAGLGLTIVLRSSPRLTSVQVSRRNWLYNLQRATGVALLLFVALHVYQTRVLADDTSTHLRMQRLLASPTGWGLYGLGVAAAAFHLAHGLWSFAVHWGLAPGRRAQGRAAVVCAGVFVAVTGLGVVTLGAF